MNRGRGPIHVAILGSIAAYFLVWPIWRAFFPMEVAPNEGWNAYHQDAAMHGVLYPPVDALTVNNYPPLSFYLVGWLGERFGDALYVGRAISILSVFGLGAAIALAVRRLGGGAIAAAIAGIWFVAVMAGAFNRFVGMNDPQLFAQFLMTVALVWFLGRDARGLSAVPPVLLMVLAGFFKHNIVVIPATVLLWLALRDRWRAWPPIAVGVLAAAAGLLICVAAYGNAFLLNLATERYYELLRALFSAGRLQWVLPALAIWAIWAWHARRTAAARFTALHVALGIVAYFVQWSGKGVVNNAQFDLLIAAAIGLGLAYEHIGVPERSTYWNVSRIRAVTVAVLAIRLMATGRIESASILFDPAYRAEFPAHAAVVESEVARVAAMKGDIWCHVKLICWRAGKPFVADDFRIEQLLHTGKYTRSDIDELLRKRGIAFVAIDGRAETQSLDRDLIRRLR